MPGYNPHTDPLVLAMMLPHRTPTEAMIRETAIQAAHAKIEAQLHAHQHQPHHPHPPQSQSPHQYQPSHQPQYQPPQTTLRRNTVRRTVRHNKYLKYKTKYLELKRLIESSQI
jgi:hypothetical protein